MAGRPPRPPPKPQHIRRASQLHYSEEQDQAQPQEPAPAPAPTRSTVHEFRAPPPPLPSKSTPYTVVSTRGVPVGFVPRNELGVPNFAAEDHHEDPLVPLKLVQLEDAADEAGLEWSGDQELELNVHLVDCSTSMWKSNKWFGAIRMEETKRLLLNNINMVSKQSDDLVRFSCLLRFSGVPQEGVKEPAVLMVPTALHDVEQKTRILDVCRLHEPCSSELDKALKPEAGTRIMSALLWTELNIIVPWIRKYSHKGATTRVFLEVYTDGKTGDPVLDMPPAMLAKYQDLFAKEAQSSPSVRSSILYAFGDDLETAKQICYKTGCESLVMVPAVETAAKEREQVIFRVRGNSMRRKGGGGTSGGGGSTGGVRTTMRERTESRMVGFNYGRIPRSDSLKLKAPGLRQIVLYISAAERILNEEGIFRIPGRAALIGAFIDPDTAVITSVPSLEELDSMDAHSVCGLLKAWLKVPPAIVPHSYALQLGEALQRRQGFTTLKDTLDIFAKEEPLASQVLNLLLTLFHQVNIRAQRNQMHAMQIATVFAPTVVECFTIDDMSAATSMLMALIQYAPLLT